MRLMGHLIPYYTDRIDGIEMRGPLIRGGITPIVEAGVTRDPMLQRSAVYTAVGLCPSHATSDVRQSDATRVAMLRIGLTGGVACGKSTVGAMLAARGAHYLQADTLAHQLYAPGEPTYHAVIEHFGQEILNPDGTINRGRLANIAFPNRIAELNAIVHPAVVDAQNQWMADAQRLDPEGVAVVEAALLLEAGADKDFDQLIVCLLYTSPSPRD